MSVAVETLDKLERKLTLNVPLAQVQAEVQKRLAKLARTVKMDGFRPGKVPLRVVAQRYGDSVHYEVLNDRIGQAFYDATQQAQLRVAGQPSIEQAAESPEGALCFDARFEVFPDVVVGDVSQVALERVSAEVSDVAIDRTLDILRKQRRTFSQRPHDAAAQDGDRATVDFEGKIDGESFAGGMAEGFQFILGEGQMLAEFEQATRGMKVGESKTFPLSFPADYHGKDVAGKMADFMVTLTKLEAAHLPDVDEALARALGVADGTVEGLRADISKNLHREVKHRLMARNKAAALDALLTVATFDLPQASVRAELDRLMQSAREDLKQRGFKDADKLPLGDDIFRPQAERRVRLGLVVAELVRAQGLKATPEQVRAHIEELAASYEKPEEVVRWYFGDAQRMADVEAVVLENNVTDYIFGQAQVTDKALSFDELMATN